MEIKREFHTTTYVTWIVKVARLTWKVKVFVWETMSRRISKAKETGTLHM